jgi:hypothetical protein
MMTKDLIYIINDLTERGLVKESSFLYSVFKKVAYETAERAEQLFNMANPNRNSSENERRIAANNLHRILEDINRPEFGYKELANMIIGKNAQEVFDSEEFLGKVLTNDEINILKQLMEPWEEEREEEEEDEEGEWDNYRRRRAREAYGEQQDDSEDRIRSVLQSLVGTILFVNIQRTRGTSEAMVTALTGDIVTFVVPVDEKKLGFKTLRIHDLISDDFIGLNPKYFRSRNWRF